MSTADHVSTKNADDLTVVLMTGFDAFDQQSINPSWEAVKALAEWHCPSATIKTQLLPCVFGEAIRVLEQAINLLKPSLILCVGQAGGRSSISVERIAINIDDARIADNSGKQPVDDPIVTDGPAAYFSNLPIKAMVHQLRTAGIPAVISNTAGTFVCNHLFYGLMHHIAAHNSSKPQHPRRGGFVHIPYLPEQATQFPDAPSMTLDVVIKALQIMTQTALITTDDIVETGGHLN